MAKKPNPSLPKVDRQAISRSKEERLLMRIAEIKRHAAYYKKWWLPSLILGLAGIFLTIASIVIGFPFPRLLTWLSIIGVLNGFYFLYKFLQEIKEKEKLEGIARKNGLLQK